MSLQLTYPANKRSKIFDDLHESTNWFSIEHDGWNLPATKTKRDFCGKWSIKGCINVDDHKQFKGKVFIKTFQRSCFRASCETCNIKWMGRQSNRSTTRIKKYEDKSKKPPKHLVISVPKWCYADSGKDMRKKAYEILKKIGCIGGALIFHPFRYKKEFKEWYYSPHFHIIGFGWITHTKEVYNKDGWVAVNLGIRKTVFGTFYYQLSHAGIKKRYHTLTWFGDLSYSKLKIEKEPNPNVCPDCNATLRPLYCEGLFATIPPPETDMEMWVNPEGWHILESIPREKRKLTYVERERYRVAKTLYSANKGTR